MHPMYPPLSWKWDRTPLPCPVRIYNFLAAMPGWDLWLKMAIHLLHGLVSIPNIPTLYNCFKEPMLKTLVKEMGSPLLNLHHFKAEKIQDSLPTFCVTAVGVLEAHQTTELHGVFIHSGRRRGIGCRHHQSHYHHHDGCQILWYSMLYKLNIYVHIYICIYVHICVYIYI